MDAVGRSERWWRLAWAPALLALVCAALIALLARDWFLKSAALVAAYFATPVAKEAWIALAPVVFGLPPAFAFFVLISFEATMSLAVLLVFPLEKLTRLAPKVDRLRVRIAESRLARRSLGGALALVIALPFHTGGAILGTLAGRALGLPRVTTFAAVVGGIGTRFLVVLLGYYGWVALRA